MSVLHLTLKKKWFDMIASGEKKEEYREMKFYWAKRLMADAGTFKDQYAVIFKNGYAKDSPTVKVEVEDVCINEGREEWGAEPGKQYFVIKLGKIL